VNERPLARPIDPDDDGSADEALRGLLAGPNRAAALAALESARLLVPVVAVPDDVDADGRDKQATMASVSMVNAHGESGLLAFTGLDSMAAWDARARPVPVMAPDAAQAALEQGDAALVVDVLGPARFVVTGPDLHHLSICPRNRVR
jgi:hypothetical protein